MSDKSRFHTYQTFDQLREAIASGAIYRQRYDAKMVKEELQAVVDWMVARLEDSLEWHETENLPVTRGQVRDIIAQEIGHRENPDAQYSPRWPGIRPVTARDIEQAVAKEQINQANAH